MPWRVGGGRWLKSAATKLAKATRGPRRGLTHGSPYVGVKSRQRAKSKPRRVARPVYRHPTRHPITPIFHRGRGFDGMVRPITLRLPRTVMLPRLSLPKIPHISLPKIIPHISQPPSARPRSTRHVRPRPTVSMRPRPKGTLENPMLYRNFMKNLRRRVDPDSWDKVDWAGETDKTLEVAEAESQLRAKYPSAFKEVEGQPTKAEIKAMIAKRRVEEEELEKDMEAARRHGQV